MPFIHASCYLSSVCPLSIHPLPTIHPSSKALQHQPRALGAHITAFVGPWCLLGAVRQIPPFPMQTRSAPGSSRSLPAGAPWTAGGARVGHKAESHVGPDFLEQRPQQPLLWVTLATRAKGELAGLWAGVNVREPLGSTRCPPASARARRTWKGGVGQAPVRDLPPGEHTLPLQCRPQWGRQTISPGERWLALLVPLSSPRLTRAISVPQE